MKYHLIKKVRQARPTLFCDVMEGLEVGEAQPCVDPDHMPEGLTFVDICAECARLHIASKKAEPQ